MKSKPAKKSQSKKLTPGLKNKNLKAKKKLKTTKGRKAAKHIAHKARTATDLVQVKEQQKKKTRTPDPEVDSRTAYVGNVPLDTTPKDILRVFSQFGKIYSFRFRGIPQAEITDSKRLAFIKKKFHPQRKSMTCFVVYNDTESVSRAIDANGLVLREHHLVIGKAVLDTPQDRRKAVFIGNLPLNAEDEDIWKLFEGFGKIRSIRLIRSSVTGIGKGFGYVNFFSTDAVELALQADEIALGKRIIRVQRCVDLNAKKERKHKRKDEQNSSKKSKSESVEENKSTAETNSDNTEVTTKKKKKKQPKKSKSVAQNDKKSTDFQGVKSSDKKKKQSQKSKSVVQNDKKPANFQSVKSSDKKKVQKKSKKPKSDSTEENKSAVETNSGNTKVTIKKKTKKQLQKSKSVAQNYKKSTDFQGVKFSDKIKKKKINKTELKRKKIIKILNVK